MKAIVLWAIAILDCINQLEKSSGGKPVNKTAISGQIGIGIDYINELIEPLKSAGYVRSVRGAQGGYHINVERLSAFQVYLTMGGGLSSTSVPPPALLVATHVEDNIEVILGCVDIIPEVTI